MKVKVIHREILVGKGHSCERVTDYDDGKKGFIFYTDSGSFQTFWPDGNVSDLINFLDKHINPTVEETK